MVLSRVIVWAALLAVLGAGCLSRPFQPTPTPIPTPGDEPPQTAVELGRLLPDTIRGQQALKRAYEGEELLSGEQDVSVDDQLLGFLDRVGAEPETILFAFSALLRSDENAAGVVAFRVIGQAEKDLTDEFRVVMDSPGAPVAWEEATVGGKQVLRAEDPDNPGNFMHLYTTDDMIFLVTAADPETAGEILEDLP